jgi:hypothetical protein
VSKYETTRKPISAKFLLSCMLGKRDAVMLPSGITITRLPARKAQGSTKPKLAGRGDGPCDSYAARSTAQIASNAENNTIRALAARGWSKSK